jgi:6-phosphogluconolactonase
MTTNRHLVILRDAALVAEFAATRLISTLVDAQAARASASVVLTGGGVGTATLKALARHPARDAIDWHELDIFWGDERFVPTGDPDRNDRGAFEVLLNEVPVDRRRVHRIPASDEVATPEEAAGAYAEVLAEVARRQGHGEPSPRFDVILLGMGPEGHVASLFPEQPAVHAQGTVVAVHGCAKPPRTRVSLTFAAIRNSVEVWVLATTAEKAPAVAQALSGMSSTALPAAGVHGRIRTLFVLDQDAAGEVPVELRPRSG